MRMPNYTPAHSGGPTCYWDSGAYPGPYGPGRRPRHVIITSPPRRAGVGGCLRCRLRARHGVFGITLVRGRSDVAASASQRYHGLMNPASQAGAIAVRLDLNRPKVLLVRPRRAKRQWIFPKGHVEKGEDPSSTALRELGEEAGVAGSIVRPIGQPVSFVSNQEPVVVQYFLVERTGDTTTLEDREQIWCDPRAAVTLVTHKNGAAAASRSSPLYRCHVARPDT